MNTLFFEKTRPLVQTKYGTLRGITYGGVNIFMGVQYATSKRFQMPTEIEPWDGIKDAYQHGPVTMQLAVTNPFHYHRGIHVLQKQTETPQNMNIWAPKTVNGELKPVFVFMHGGGFFAGNAYEEISFDGFNMAHNGDVVFVSINHRLNVLAHLNLEEYGPQYKNSANAGIGDLVKALKYIHENIAAFGGDPNNVTICGHSGGGGKVQCMFQIEEAAQYFQRGMVMSGARGKGGLSPEQERENSLKTAKAIMDELGITKENIDKINEVPFEDIKKACNKVASPFSWSPVPDDFFPGFPAVVGLMPFSKDKPVIYSSTLAEFPAISIDPDEKMAMTKDDQVAYLKNLLGEHADEMMDLFSKAYPDHQIIDLGFMDSRCRLGASQSAVAHVEAGCENAYLMMCSYCVPEYGWIPIWHGGEMAYIFQNEDCVLVLNEEVWGQRWANMLSTLTLNFVKYGDPNCKYLPKWTPVTDGKKSTMIIDCEPRDVVNHDDKLVDMVAEFGPKFQIKLSHSVE